MDRRFTFVLITLLISSVSSSVEFFGGITELMKYESTLPCETGAKQKCFATNGLMGLTLDTASQAGLNISSVLIDKNQKVFVTSKDEGTCLVEMPASSKQVPVTFHCSKEGITKKGKKSFTKKITLVQKNDKSFALKEIATNSKKTKGL